MCQNIDAGAEDVKEVFRNLHHAFNVAGRRIRDNPHLCLSMRKTLLGVLKLLHGPIIRIVGNGTNKVADNEEVLGNILSLAMLKDIITEEMAKDTVSSHNLPVNPKLN
jgi:hypothetical protein